MKGESGERGRYPALDNVWDWVSSRRERIRSYALVAALVVFALGLYWAITRNPELVADLELAPLVLLVVISAPIGTILNAAELWALSRIAGGPMSWRTSFDVTIYTSAANMLPIPGGAMTKIAGFHAHGVGYRVALSMILLSFLLWGGLAFVFSAVALAVLDHGWQAATFLGAGLVLLVASAAGFARFGHWPMVAIAAASRLLNFVVEGLRYWLAFAAMGLTVSFLHCSVFVVVTFVGAAVVFVPAGLGVSEATGALVASLIGLQAASGFLSTAIQRVARLAGLGAIALGFLLWQRGPGARPAETTQGRAGPPREP